jgi:hypothetical protein
LATSTAKMKTAAQVIDGLTGTLLGGKTERL